MGGPLQWRGAGFAPGPPGIAFNSTEIMRTVSLLVLAAVAGCVSAPPADPTPAETTVRVGSVSTGDDHTGSMRLYNEGAAQERSFAATVPAVWQALMATYNQLEIPVTDIAADRHRLESRGVRVSTVGGQRMSRYLDCGSSVTGDRADNWVVSISLVSSVTAVEDGGSLLRIDLDAAANPRVASGGAVHCTSRSTMEARILDEVGKRVGG